MSRIEEIVFKSIELGIQERLYTRVNKMIGNSEYKHFELNRLYEIALEKEKEVLHNNNLYKPPIG